MIVTQVKKLRCHDYNCLCKACLVGRFNYISVKSTHFEQRKRTGGKIQMFSIQVRQHWNREDATFCPLFIPICRFYSTEGEQLHNEGNDKNRISDAMYIHEICVPWKLMIYLNNLNNQWTFMLISNIVTIADAVNLSLFSIAGTLVKCIYALISCVNNVENYALLWSKIFSMKMHGYKFLKISCLI